MFTRRVLGVAVVLQSNLLILENKAVWSGKKKETSLSFTLSILGTLSNKWRVTFTVTALHTACMRSDCIDIPCRSRLGLLDGGVLLLGLTQT